MAPGKILFVGSSIFRLWESVRTDMAPLPVFNHAFGGSRTDASAGVPFGMLNQLSRYTAAGGRFNSTDLVSVLGGANDIFQGLPVAGASASPVAAITSFLPIEEFRTCCQFIRRGLGFRKFTQK